MALAKHLWRKEGRVYRIFWIKIWKDSEELALLWWSNKESHFFLVWSSSCLITVESRKSSWYRRRFATKRQSKKSVFRKLGEIQSGDVSETTVQRMKDACPRDVAASSSFSLWMFLYWAIFNVLIGLSLLL